MLGGKEADGMINSVDPDRVLFQNETNQAQGYKTFSCSTQLSMNFFLLINVEMPITVGKAGTKAYLRLKNAKFLNLFSYEHLKMHAQLS